MQFKDEEGGSRSFIDHQFILLGELCFGIIGHYFGAICPVEVKH